MEVDCGLVMTLRSVDAGGDASGENESLAYGDGGAITGTACSSDGLPPAPALPLAPVEGGGILTVVGTAFVAGGILTTTGPAAGLLDTAAAASVVGLAAVLHGCDAGMLTTVAVGLGSESSLPDEDLLM